MYMTKKCYALIKAAQENAQQIKNITDILDLDKISDQKTKQQIKQIMTINQGFYNQFKDTDPDWTPNKKQESVTSIKTVYETYDDDKDDSKAIFS